MPKKPTPKSSSSADKKAYIQEVKEEIRAIGTISTWLLGFLAIIVAALTSFVFQDLNTLIAESNFPVLKPGVVTLLVAYLAIAAYILSVLVIIFTAPNMRHESLDNIIEFDEKRLDISKKRLKTVIISVIGSLFIVCAFAIYFSYFLYA